MVWPQVIYYLITLVLSIALAPKPPKPRPATLEDFEFPTAEEDRPIPWIFGTVRITGPNVVWYGDLAVKKIKKSGLFSSTTIGYQYFIGIHFVLGGGPWDALLQIEIGEKLLWEGELTESTVGTKVKNDALFGGKKREGGAAIDFDLMMGEADQEPNAYLTSAIDGPMPAYRGVVGVVSKRTTTISDGDATSHGLPKFGRWGYIGNTPYPKAWAFTGRRVLKGWDDDLPWYSEKALVTLAGGGSGMNPAHMIYEVLTSTEFGQGEPTSRINDTQFRDAADALFDEGFGLNMQWAQSGSCDDFIAEICNHASGLLALDRTANQYIFKLVRGDYDPDDLPAFGPSQIKRMTKCERRGWGDTINVVNLSYTDPDTLKSTSITAHDLGNIRAQGRRVSTAVRMPGIQDHALAATVASRELLHRSTPLASIEFDINRSFWEQIMGGVVKINWPLRQMAGTVFRILTVRHSELVEDDISVQAVEDIYALGYADYLVSPPVLPPPTPPEAADDSPDNGQNIKGQVASDEDLPTNPADGDRYIVDGVLVEWDEDQLEWQEVEVPDGTLFFNEDTGSYQTFGGSGLENAPFTPAIALLEPVDDTNPDLNDFEIVVYNPDTDEYYTLLASQIGGGSSPLTTKGDLIVRGVAIEERLPVGAPGQLLTVDPSAPLGVKWETGLSASPVGEAASAARARLGSNQAIPNGTVTLVEFDTEEFDTDNYLGGTDAGILVVPTDGKYIVGACVQWDASTTGTRTLFIAVNGATSDSYARAHNPASAGLSHNVVDCLDLLAGDNVAFYVVQDSGGSVDIISNDRVTSACCARVGVTAAPTQVRGATWIRSTTLLTPLDDIDVSCPVKGQIVGVRITTKGGTGACVVDIWKDSWANFPPTGADSICAAAKPTIASGIKYEDTTLSGWTTTVNAGDVLMFHLESTTVFKRISIQVFIKEIP